MDSVARRKNATRETTNTLKAWLYEHRKNPYPTKGEKIMLAIITKMTLTQVSTWFANARRRLKKENKMTWEPRNKSGEATDQDDKDDGNCSSSSPPASDIVGKKSSRDDSMNGCHDDDSGDLRVKPEISSNPIEDRTKIPDFGSCSVKTESTGLRPAGCLTGINQYQGVTNSQRMLGCSSNTQTFRSQSPISPGGRMPLLPPERIHPVHHGYHQQYDDRYLHKHYHHHQQQQHHRPGSPCSGGTMCDVTGHLNMDERPKIWSLAHTATSNSPPNLKRSESLTQIMPVPTVAEEYALNCGSPKEPSTALAPGSGAYACGGRLASHHPPDAGEAVRRNSAWLNGDNGIRSDCAQEPQTIVANSDCDNSKGQYSCYNGPVRGGYVSSGMYDANKCYSGSVLSTQPVFQSCLSPSSNCNQNYKTEHVITASSYLGGCAEVASASSSTASSPGVTTRPRPSDIQQSSCEYMQSLVPATRKPAGYLEDEKSVNSVGMSATLPEFEPCEMTSTVNRGKPVQPEKGDILVTESVSISTQPCLALIR